MINYEEELNKMARLIVTMIIDHPEVDNLQTELLCRQLYRLGFIEYNAQRNEWVFKIEE